MGADKPIIRIAVPGDTAEDFMQAAAKQFRGDFFVAIDQPVGKYVRIEAPFLAGDVGVRGDAIAMPAVRNGRKGLVIRLVKLDADSLGIPIQESTKELSLEDDDDAVEEFDSSQSTVASNVSAAVAKSIRAATTSSDRAQPVPLKTPTPATGVPKPAAKSPSQPTNLADLDDETREAVDEFGDVSTRASEVSADLARMLAEKPATATAHAVRRATPGAGVPKQATPPSGTPAVAKPADDDDAGLDSAFTDGEPSEHDRPTVEAPPLAKPAELEDKPEVEDKLEVEDKPEVEDIRTAEPEDKVPVPARAAEPKSKMVLLVVLLIAVIAAAVVFVMQL